MILTLRRDLIYSKALSTFLTVAGGEIEGSAA